MTVLVRRSSLGDVVLLGAVTKALGDVTVVTAPEWASVAARLVGVRRVVAWPREAPLREVVAAAGPGRWIDLQGSARSVALCAHAGGDARIRKHSIRRRLRLGALGRRLVAPRPRVTTSYAEACGVLPAEAPWIDVPAVTRDALVLLPGASAWTKRWPPDRFAAAGRAFNGPVVVAGSLAETDLVRTVAAAVPGSVTVAERGFSATIDALSRARVAVGNDSGLLHLAAACGVPVVAVFAGTHPDDGFFVHRGEVVQRDLACRPCSLHGRGGCPLGHGACRDVDAVDVIAAMRRCAG